MATGNRTSYTDSNIRRRAITDWVEMLGWQDAGLLKRFGTNNETKMRLLNWPNTKFEWITDALATRTGTIDEALDGSETGVDVQTGEADYVKAGDVIRIDDELMWVSSVSAPTLTVVRGFAGTTATTHTDDTAWEIVTMAQLEGANATTGYTTTTASPYNYTQIISESVKVTRTQQKISDYGVPDTMKYHLEHLIGGGHVDGVQKRAGKLPILLQGIFYHGQRAVGSATTARSAGGFEAFVTTNTSNASSARLTKALLENLCADIVDDGGMPDTIVVPTFQRRMLTTLYGEDQVYYERSETTGGRRIQYIETDLGLRMEIVWDYLCPTDRLYVVESSKVGWVTFDDFAIVDIAPAGDYEQKDVVGEFSFVVTNEQANGYIYGLATS